ncbi:MAG: aspartate 1-decarboxylase [Candidatus Woesearchaeota archaeon]
MYTFILKSKIHRATISASNPDYEGSLTIDKNLMDAANIHNFEQVHVLSLTTGERLITYAIPGKEGVICTNGAAAKKIRAGEVVIILTYCILPESEVNHFKPRIVLVNQQNEIKSIPSVNEHINNML